MTKSYINRIATAVPANEVHDFFRAFAAASLEGEPRKRDAFLKMATRSGIRSRYSCIEASDDPTGPAVDTAGLFHRGHFPGTATRMNFYEHHAADLSMQAIDRLGLGDKRRAISHLIVASCTGMSAPGLDLEILHRVGLPGSTERTLIGFMGCYAAVNALKLADHIIRSDHKAHVLVVNCELCTLHLQETTDLEKLLTFCLWGDGASAALVSSVPEGIEIGSFLSLVARDARDLMTWHVRDDGFEMMLSGRVPTAIRKVLGENVDAILNGRSVADIALWAVHPGGRSVLDAVERTLGLGPEALDISREVLRDNGNMSSATVMFVLERMLAQAAPGERGCGMAFGPGLTAETMTFRKAA